jgi:hypothetical protein
VPTATSFAEGVMVRLSTPDPSPDCPQHYPWFFDNPARECAATMLNTWGTMQSFERGLMVWFQSYGETFILLDDGSVFKSYVEARDLAGVAEPGQPDPALVPPNGLFQPERGFAKFWRGMVPGYQWVREALGWATRPEEGYSAFYQCNERTDESARCYFSGPQDQVIAITRGAAHFWNYARRPAR